MRSPWLRMEAGGRGNAIHSTGKRGSSSLRGTASLNKYNDLRSNDQTYKKKDRKKKENIINNVRYKEIQQYTETTNTTSATARIRSWGDPSLFNNIFYKKERSQRQHKNYNRGKVNRGKHQYKSFINKGQQKFQFIHR